MNRDIEKIKAALGEIHKLQQETAYSLMDVNKDMMRYMSAMAIIGVKVQEAFAALEAYNTYADDLDFAKEWLDREVKHPENTTRKLAEFIAIIRANAKVDPDAIRRECAERAWDWFCGKSKEDNFPAKKEALTAAIISAGPQP